MDYLYQTNPAIPSQQDNKPQPKYWCAYCRKRYTYCTYPEASSRPHCPKCNVLIQELPAFLLSSSRSASTSAQSSPNTSHSSLSSYDYGQNRRECDGLGRGNVESVQKQGTQQDKNPFFSRLFTKVLDFFLGSYDLPGSPDFSSTLNLSENTNGVVPKGTNHNESVFLDQETSKKLEETKFVCTKKNKGLSCTICHEDYKNDDAILRLPCRHEYHKKCLNEWFNKQKSCPMCRQRI